ncbi:MAG: hypothetical protein ACREYE_20250, partial [Gammaproteobacteria bacterium]
VRVYPPVSLRLPSAVLPALLKRQLTISRTSAEFMQAYRKDTVPEIIVGRRSPMAFAVDPVFHSVQTKLPVTTFYPCRLLPNT